MMKRLLVGACVVLGCIGTTRAQENTATGTTSKGSTVNFATTSAADTTLVPAPSTSPFMATPFSQPAANSPGAFSTPSSTAAFADPAATPAPTPEPKFFFGGRDDYRWQLGLAATWVRFRSDIFNASAVGVKTSLSYFTNDWLAIEGNITAAYAPEIFVNEHVKLLVYGAGPKLAWRQKRWEPWAHALFGGIHEQPQTAFGSKNAFALQAGGGADYRFNPRLSGRLEGDYIRTSLFNETQNNFQLAGGVVFHF